MGSIVDHAEEAERAAALMDAQNKAAEMFEKIEKTLLRSGVTEAALTKEIFELGAERYGCDKYWHKRIVRSGPNTLHPYEDNPADRMIEPDDILFVDLGPVFEKWEADFGRTYVLGDDPVKQRLRDSLEPAWHRVKARFQEDGDITGEKLYSLACEEAERQGYEFGGIHAGHLVGSFPHERIPRDKVVFYITKGNDNEMRSVDKHGHKRHWILEIHFVDKERQIGGFFEQLLTVD